MISCVPPPSVPSKICPFQTDTRAHLSTALLREYGRSRRSGGCVLWRGGVVTCVLGERMYIRAYVYKATLSPLLSMSYTSLSPSQNLLHLLSQLLSLSSLSPFPAGSTLPGPPQFLLMHLSRLVRTSTGRCLVREPDVPAAPR